MVVLMVSNLFAKMDMVTEMYMHDPIPNISSGWGGVGGAGVGWSRGGVPEIPNL